MSGGGSTPPSNQMPSEIGWSEMGATRPTPSSAGRVDSTAPVNPIDSDWLLLISSFHGTAIDWLHFIGRILCG